MALLAQGQAPGGGGGLIATFAPFVIILFIFYFLMIRPQQKRQESHRKFVEALKKGDEVVTEGGMLGKVVSVDDKTVTLELGRGTKVKFLKQSVRGSQQSELSDDDDKPAEKTADSTDEKDE